MRRLAGRRSSPRREAAPSPASTGHGVRDARARGARFWLQPGFRHVPAGASHAALSLPPFTGRDRRNATMGRKNDRCRLGGYPDLKLPLRRLQCCEHLGSFSVCRPRTLETFGKPPLPEPAQVAARAKAAERYEAFVSALGRRPAHGPKLRQEISEDVEPDHDHP